MGSTFRLSGTSARTSTRASTLLLRRGLLRRDRSGGSLRRERSGGLLRRGHTPRRLFRPLPRHLRPVRVGDAEKHVELLHAKLLQHPVRLDRSGVVARDGSILCFGRSTRCRCRKQNNRSKQKR